MAYYLEYPVRLLQPRSYNPEIINPMEEVSKALLNLDISNFWENFKLWIEFMKQWNYQKAIEQFN